MDYTPEQMAVFEECCQLLREAEERKGRNGLRIRLYANRYWNHIQMPKDSILPLGIITKLQAVGIEGYLKIGKECKFFLLKRLDKAKR